MIEGIIMLKFASKSFIGLKALENKRKEGIYKNSLFNCNFNCL